MMLSEPNAIEPLALEVLDLLHDPSKKFRISLL
jgi:hypothetical protein